MDNGAPDCPYKDIIALAKLLGMSDDAALYLPAMVIKAAIKKINENKRSK